MEVHQKCAQLENLGEDLVFWESVGKMYISPWAGKVKTHTFDSGYPPVPNIPPPDVQVTVPPLIPLPEYKALVRYSRTISCNDVSVISDDFNRSSK